MPVIKKSDGRRKSYEPRWGLGIFEFTVCILVYPVWFWHRGKSWFSNNALRYTLESLGSTPQCQVLHWKLLCLISASYFTLSLGVKRQERLPNRAYFWLWGFVVLGFLFAENHWKKAWLTQDFLGTEVRISEINEIPIDETWPLDHAL